ncbi:hypothetical protein FACS1894127_1770 [Clostridia bacterium]|nr:hypothetical protein FACS1894127_1770 [Clostridia bacterium]
MRNLKAYQVTFVNCEQLDNHLVSFATNVDCLYVRAFLKENGIESVQFISDNLPNIYDLTDDILSLAGDAIVFYVNELNFYLLKIITYEIKKIDSDKMIIFFGPMLIYDFGYVLNNAQVDVCVLSNPEKNIYELLKNDCEDYQNLSGIAHKVDKKILANTDISSSNFIPSPYVTKLVSGNNAQKFGIIVSRGSGSNEYCISPEYLKMNLEVIFSAIPEKNVCIPLVCDDISEYHYFTDLQRILMNFPFTYKSKIKVQHIDYEMIHALVQFNFIRIDVVIDDGKYLSDDIHWMNVLLRFASEKVKFSFTFDFPATEMNRFDLINTVKVFIQNGFNTPKDYTFRGASICSPKTYPERNVILNDNDLLLMINSDKYPPAFIDGFISFMTGMYPPVALNNSVKHVEIANEKLTLEEMDALKEFISVNSAIIAPISKDSKLYNDSVFYMEGDNSLRSQNEIYDENIANAYNNNFYLPHLYSLNEDESQVKSLIIDDFNTHSPLQFSCIPYAKADSKLSKAINLLSIETSDDLEKFLYDVEFFISNGMFGNLYEINYKIKDACRWLSSTGCLVSKLPRFKLENNGLISPCGGCRNSIGSVHDSYFKIYRQIHVMSEEAQIDRECSICEIKDECSKCCFLPDFLQADQFCEVMKKRPYINMYMDTKLTLSVLMEKSIFRHVELSDIKVSNKYVSKLIPNHLVEKNSEYLYPYIYLFHANEKHYVINAATGKVFGANEKMACVMELFQKCVDIQTVKDFLAENYNLDEAHANKTFIKITSSFIQSGFMRRMVI